MSTSTPTTVTPLPTTTSTTITTHTTTSQLRTAGELCLVAGCCVSMVVATTISDVVQTRLEFSHPYFLTWFGSSWLLVFAILQLCRHWLGWRDREKDDDSRRGILHATAEIEGSVQQINTTASPSPSSTRRLFLLALPFSLLWFAANYLFVLGLAWSTVASSLSLEQAATVLVYLLSMVVLKEWGTFPKSMAVVLTIAGTALVAWADSRSTASSDATHPLFGDGLVLLSTVATAVYLVGFKASLKGLSFDELLTFLGFIGLWIFVLFSPGIFVLRLLNIEVFSIPFNNAPLLLALMGGALVSLLYNFLLNYGVYKVTPLFMRVGIMCTIPLSFGVNTLLGDTFSWFRLSGAVCIVVGFAFMFFNRRPSGGDGDEA